MLKKALIFPFGLLSYLFSTFLDAAAKCEQDIRDAIDTRYEAKRTAWLITLDPDKLAESGKLEDAILAGQARVAQGIGYKNQSGHKARV
ncbi:MAG TPA: hypothetical protein DCW88_04910 [Agrobacterium sp.]|uniref:hypothetical protein n=1 Tax=Agrobacterium pusense TaxID=648995 RepID=UPI000E9095D4|nr:hypothetical protein [Agrobacterium sp.]